MLADRPYQAACIEKLRESVTQGHRRIVVVSPTGSGKTWLAARLMQNATERGKRSAFFADQIELIDQASATLDKLKVAHNTMRVTRNRRYEHDTLASVISKDTLWARAFRSSVADRPHLDLVIFDEAHKSIAKTWRAISDYYRNAIVIGLTATPCRGDGRGMGENYTDLVTMAKYSELIADNRIVPCKIWAPHRPDMKGVKVSKGDYHKLQLEQRMKRDVLVGDIIGDWKQRAESRKTVVFASSVAHSVEIRDAFRRAGINAEHLDGTMSSGSEEREEIIGKLRDGRINVICNYGVLTTGIDVADLKYMINARPTKCFQLWRQMAGRVMRACDGHDHCVIQDHSDCTVRFGFPDEDVEWELDVSTRAEERIARTRETNPEVASRICKQCTEVFKGPSCPKCGWKADVWQSVKTPTMEAGDLKEMERIKARRETSLEDKQKFWERCIGEAIGANRKVSYASVRFKGKFGVWPNRVRGLRCAANYSVSDMDAREFYHKYVAPSKVRANEPTGESFDVEW